MSGLDDLADVLNEQDRRLFDLEQTMTSPQVMTTGAPVEGITFIEPGVSVLPTPPDDITGLTATPGTFFNDIYVDVDWSAPMTVPLATSFDIELSERSAGPTYALVSQDVTGGTSYRFLALKPNQDYSVRVTPVNNIGIRGNTSAYVDFTTAADATIPPAPTGVSVARGASSVVVLYTGLTYAQAPDVANGRGLYIIQIDTANTFSTGNLKTMRSTATIVAFESIDTPDNYYARVAAIDESGNQSAWSSTAGPSVAGGVIDTMIVSGLNAAKITFGSMSGDRITANTLDVATIKTSTITAADITVNGGSIKLGSPPTTGVLINSQGIRVYASSVLKMVMDATTGSITVNGSITSGSTISGATVSGTTITGGSISGATVTGGTVVGAVIETNSTGQRIVIDTSPAHIYLYSGGGSETWPAEVSAFTSGGGGVTSLIANQISGGARPYVQLGSNATAANQFCDIGNIASFYVNATDLMEVAAGRVIFDMSGTGGTIDFGSPGGFFMQEIATGGGRYGIKVSGLDASNAGMQFTVGGSYVYCHVLEAYATGTSYSGALVWSGDDGFGARWQFVDPSNSTFKVVAASEFRVSSSEIFKSDIVDMDVETNTVDQVRPREFTLDSTGERQLGFVAEELVQAVPLAVTQNEAGECMFINYNMLIPVLFKELQELRSRVAVLEPA